MSLLATLLFWGATVFTSYAAYERLSVRWVPEGEVTSVPAEFFTLLAVIAMQVVLIQFLQLGSY